MVTPERVVEMCELLGIDIVGSAPEYFLLWLAVEVWGSDCDWASDEAPSTSPCGDAMSANDTLRLPPSMPVSGRPSLHHCRRSGAACRVSQIRRPPPPQKGQRVAPQKGM